MSKARFEIAFEGKPFDGGEIDVRDLAPTLLALGNVVQAANKALNGDRSEARLKVTATKEGSFVAALTMDVSWLIDMLDAVAANPDRVLAADQLLGLLMNAGKVVGVAAGTATAATVGVFQAIKLLRGRRPSKVVPLGDGTTQITVEQTVFVVADRCVDLLQDLGTREAIESFGNKASSVEGLKALKIGDGRDDSRTVTLSRSDLPSLNVPPEPKEPEVDISHREAWLKPVSAQFKDGYKWRFTDGGDRPFTAEMEDLDFQRRVQEGRVTLNANDTIRCRLREEQSISAASLMKATFVEEVLDHRPGARQLNLL
ncbi:hypothetical protein PVT71_14470 [Salipiger sp. H15]|uniref:Uncharacterized protein n=1 Tax=Alloyangia sp. H15 TaxID=3029062 RepID=A0AAU8AN52_9RHOB